jgi:hypothetical protein
MPRTSNLTAKDKEALLNVLKDRFDANLNRHKGMKWKDVLERIEIDQKKLWSLHQMEETGGEPDVIGYDKKKDEFLFCDCSAESPKGRRSVCYDHEALESRKEHKPQHSAAGMTKEMGIELLGEEQYRELQKFGPFDTKTSSWILTPERIRALGGALFCDYRYGTVFTYHNGAESYYAARGFRGMLRV